MTTPLRIAVLKERANGETRVAATPETVKKFKKAGYDLPAMYKKAKASGTDYFDAILDAVEKLSKKVAAMKIGDGTEQGVTQGPLINMEAVDKVEKHIADAVKGGAKIITGGKRHALGVGFRGDPAADVFVCVDSDTILDPHALDAGLGPFADQRVSGVAGFVTANPGYADLIDAAHPGLARPR